MSMSSNYWCYRCNRFITVRNQDSITCPNCNSGFVEELVETPNRSPLSASRRRRFPAVASDSGPTLQRSRRNGGDRSPFNPVIVLRSPSRGGGTGGGDGGGGAAGAFELYYGDGSGSGLRPLPASMSEFLLGSGFDRLLDQLAQIDVGRIENPPASKAAIESMPTIEIVPSHVDVESHCAVCMESFELGTEAREMPCKHLYHSDCILPWLSLRNSCPVCRQELPTESGGDSNEQNRNVGHDDEAVGLTIWRLPGGGFAVGRFGRMVGGERELPVVYTEMDGGFNSNGVPRRISWGSGGGRESQQNGGLRRLFCSFFSCFGGAASSSSETSGSDLRTNRNTSGSLSSVFISTSRRRRDWDFETNTEA
ncbi:PREDICTED: probable E3 ubiquitin-protein ligase RHC2A [Nicotiana attenuata]|uniref:RING-type E3 ubiquitin transferase n=1 Tax=Nicotiana attenuata TaxID=49451 RepID=A0A1J6HZW3_NICAT|nr:PREDICTED: probable E3 ubiquitin-protein ligase RHC2A [Nicotiana attenuata]OIS97865.1 e3 ubiquitin-protein ligase rduf2 [Nicotiana attenuata]